VVPIRRCHRVGGILCSSFSIFAQTFFVADFDPDIVIGPTVLEFLQDFFSRHHSSVDVILTVLQVSANNPYKSSIF
jgi:hypothetical protein